MNINMNPEKVAAFKDADGFLHSTANAAIRADYRKKITERFLKASTELQDPYHGLEFMLSNIETIVELLRGYPTKKEMP